MKNNKGMKIAIAIALVVAVAGLSVGFAALSQNLQINSSASFKGDGDTWLISFDTGELSGFGSNSSNEFQPTRTSQVSLHIETSLLQ